MKHREYIANSLRKQAGIISSAKHGEEIRSSVSKGFIDIALFIEENEIPVRAFANRMYFKGIITGISVFALISCVAVLLLK